MKKNKSIIGFVSVTVPSHLADAVDTRDRIPIEPRDPKDREQNRKFVQDNLRLPGFTLPDVVLGVNHRQWWRPLQANPYEWLWLNNRPFGAHKHRTKRNQDRVAKRLGGVYEAALAELKLVPPLGATTGRVMRAHILTPALYERILRRLVINHPAWAPLREDKGKRDLSYGMRVYDDARRKFLASPTRMTLWEGTIPLARPPSQPAWDPRPCPAATGKHFKSAYAEYMRSREGYQVRAVMKEAEMLDTILTPTLKKLTFRVEDLLARENLQLAKRVRELEDENQTMRPQVDCLREASMIRQERRRVEWQDELMSYNYRQREEGKEVFPMESLHGFLGWIEAKEKERL
ncbi:hypothetical protein LZ30DRAFT_785637 [Colletotrichum cereale]|nr:hypothetical protein LZ30DRAFT_785637 [Colletotrichum cereale]